VRELSLHILDLVENSVRAGASVVRVEVEDDREADRMQVVVEDNGSGLAVEPEQALDPFYTTKPGKRTGLGLALLRFQAEQAGGGLELGRSKLGGLMARATWKRSHVDRFPLGDLGGTLSGVVACAPEGLDLQVWLRAGGRRISVSSAEIAGREGAALAAALTLGERIRQGMSDLSIEA
jgi:signal transduction histidine kinase